MRCPFRLSVSFEYVKVDGTESDYLEKSQLQEYPECYENECPYFDYHGNCDRIGGD